jgi:hypothetical protein
MGELDKQGVVTMEELVVSSFSRRIFQNRC